LPEIDLLRALPKPKRDFDARKKVVKDPNVAAVAKQYGRDYFDGQRSFGYGGYHYDGRWVPVADDIIDHYGLGITDMVLDIGCAKGFLVHDLYIAAPEAFGLDISSYAIRNCHPDVVGRLHLGSADDLSIFPDDSFDLVLSINTLHNLPRSRLVKALQEIMRVSRGSAFVQVDSYRTPEQKAVFEDWVLTAQFHDYPDGWLKLFAEAGYTGDYAWTIVE